MEPTDKSLIKAHCQGSPTAFTELLSRYGDTVLGYLIQMYGNREQAEDFFQETFKRVHEKAHTFRGPRLKPWLLAIATRVAIDGLRKNRRLKVVSLNQKTDCTNGDCGESGTAAILDNSRNPLDEAANAEQKQQVRQAINFLPAKQRATLVLAYYQQLSYPEVAAVLGCSVGTVKTQMYRALRTLAQKLPEFGGEMK
ncbi:MAG: RNA polymerase sigma factor [Planctomycetota bacterium]